MVISYLFQGNKKNNWRCFAAGFPLKIFCMSALGRSREGPKIPKTLWNVHEKSKTWQTLTILTCLALFTCKELFNYRLELRAEVVAVEPAFKENLGALRDKIPANMMIAVANYHVQHHNFKINLSPSVSSCRRSLSTTRPTVSAPRFGEWGILEKILSAGYPLHSYLQNLQKNKDVFFS